MPIAAVPNYMGRDFSTASPGLRFGMYLPYWGVDNSTSELLWTTHDINQRTSGPRQELREFKDENKTAALKQSVRMGANDLATMNALVQRQAALASPLLEQGRLLCVAAKAVAPFTTGLGNEHPLENGFSFLNPYGLPYLPGSGVKGVLRQSAGELASGDWGDPKGWDEAAIDVLFGKVLDDDEDTGHQRGALTFWDVLPQLVGDALQVEVMTPHQSHYYQQREDDRSGGSSSPHESGQPNPINFLTVPPGSGFAFHVQCDLPFLARLAPGLAQDQRWQVLLQSALAHAFQWLGFGAKTAVGYGAMTVDAERAARAAQTRDAARREREKQAELAQREAAKASMSPSEKAMADIYDQRVDKNQVERSVLFQALKGGKLSEHRRAVAERLRALMQQERRWRESSEKKKPEKDEPYQETLQVKKWLEA